jgi:hypothetical protein
VGVVVPAVVEDLGIGGIGMHDQVEEGLGRIDRLGVVMTTCLSDSPFSTDSMRS